jgi:hypothetical protein
MTASAQTSARTRHPRGIDHLVVAVKDLEAGREIWQRLGFTMTPRAVHPWGTCNTLAQLDHCFIEVLSVADPALIRPTTKRFFSFGAFNRDFLKKREGGAMLVLESADANADIADFAVRGLDTFPRFNFERQATQPDGELARVAFSLAFTRAVNSAGVGTKASGFFTCQQHEPQNFWHAAYQRHANTATTMQSVAFVARNPADYHEFLKDFSGVDTLRSSSAGVVASTPRGEIAILTPAAFANFYGEAALAGANGDLDMRAVTFGVTEFGDAAASLVAGGLSVIDHRDALIVPASAALGLTVAFRANAR